MKQLLTREQLESYLSINENDVYGESYYSASSSNITRITDNL